MSTKKNQFTGKYFVILLATTLILAIFVAFKLINSQSFRSDAVNTELTEITTQSSDSEVQSIEKDLDNTNFDTLDKELDDIESEFNTSL